MPRAAGEALQRHVLHLGGLADEELGDGVRVTGEVRRRGDILLDDAEAALGIGDHEQAPEERPALLRVRDPDVERPLEHDSLRHPHEQPVLPERGVVSCELLVRGDERAEQLVVPQRLKRDALWRALDLDAVLGDRGEAGHVEVEHRPGGHVGGLSPDVPVRVEAVRIEGAEVGEPPRLVGRRRER